MKKTLLSTICFFGCILFIHAQTLYGTTVYGGEDGGGTINKFIPATTNLTIVKSLESLAQYPGNTRFVQASNGKLYGMTGGGGSDGTGVIFSFDPSSSTYTKLKDFSQINGNGHYPSGSLIEARDGKLYGMTNAGGIDNAGVIFSFDPNSSTYTKLKDFNFSNGDGASPAGSLMQARDGKLYGMTYYGGSNDYGVIFSFDPLASTYTKLIDFDNTNGANPSGSLMQASDGKLYGMTSGGGTGITFYGRTAGVIFSFDPLASTYTKLVDFDRTNGASPEGSLMQASDGKLYGMTFQGGNISANAGVIFSFDPLDFTYTKLIDFDYTNGAQPTGNFIQASDGKLYGMTRQGGVNNQGILFSFDFSSTAYTLLVDFGIYQLNQSFDNANGSPIQAKDGKLYGMTRHGKSGNGEIFSFDISLSIV